jgi:signal transduction histidine kinase
VSRLRRDSPLWAAARVAAVATAIAAVLYAVAAVGIVVLVLDTLTQRVDGALAAQLHYFQERPLSALERAQGQAGASNGPRDAFAASALWIVYPDGQVQASPASPSLPQQYRHAEAPTAVTIQGYGYRLVGGPLGNGWLVLGTSSDYVDFTARALIIEVLVVAIPVLVLVFLSALAIGRWSAAPIDRARRRLLEFTADASHELRTPLQVIEAEVSLALLVQRSASSYRETIENISRESHRLRHLVDDLLWLARVDSLPGRPRSEVVDVGQLAGDAVERFRAPAEQKGQRLSLEAGRGGQSLVLAPPDWIDRLLGVLIDNACRYTPPGGAIRVAVETRDGQVTLRVDDSGPGIPADQRERVFERFHRLSDDGRGSGLGLSIAGAVVQATRGRWRLGESAENGASMAVSWPAVRGPREAVVTGTERAPHIAPGP